MSVNMMSKVFSCNVPELKTDDGKTVPDSTAKFVLLALADNANEEGEGAYPGVDSLCEKTNFSTATVCNALNALRFNGFTTLVGKSKRDTNNYTILVAKILEFQWLKRSDSSGRNASVLAAKTNPSLNHHLTTPPAQIQKIKESADKAVDAILENERKAKGRQWTNLPEIYHQFGKTFQDCTGIVYTKKQAFDWMAEFDEWLKAGFKPEDVERAIRAIQADNKISISRPGSITWKLRAQVAAAHIAAPAQPEQSQWEQFYRVPTPEELAAEEAQKQAERQATWEAFQAAKKLRAQVPA